MRRATDILYWCTNPYKANEFAGESLESRGYVKKTSTEIPELSALNKFCATNLWVRQGTKVNLLSSSRCFMYSAIETVIFTHLPSRWLLFRTTILLPSRCPVLNGGTSSDSPPNSSNNRIDSFTSVQQSDDSFSEILWQLSWLGCNRFAERAIIRSLKCNLDRFRQC